MEDIFEFYERQNQEARVRNFQKQAKACNALYMEYKKGTTQIEKDISVAYGALMNEYMLLSNYFSTGSQLANFDVKACLTKVVLHHFNLKTYHSTMYIDTNFPIEKVRKELSEGLCAGAAAAIKTL